MDWPKPRQIHTRVTATSSKGTEAAKPDSPPTPPSSRTGDTTQAGRPSRLPEAQPRPEVRPQDSPSLILLVLPLPGNTHSAPPT